MIKMFSPMAEKHLLLILPHPQWRWATKWGLLGRRSCWSLHELCHTQWQSGRPGRPLIQWAPPCAAQSGRLPDWPCRMRWWSAWMPTYGGKDQQVITAWGLPGVPVSSPRPAETWKRPDVSLWKEVFGLVEEGNGGSANDAQQKWIKLVSMAWKKMVNLSPYSIKEVIMRLSFNRSVVHVLQIV